MRITRYEVVLGQNAINMPDGAELLTLSLGRQSSRVYVVARVDPAAATRERRVFVELPNEDLPPAASGWPWIGYVMTKVEPVQHWFAFDAGWAP